MHNKYTNNNNSKFLSQFVSEEREQLSPYSRRVRFPEYVSKLLGVFLEISFVQQLVSAEEQRRRRIIRTKCFSQIFFLFSENHIIIIELKSNLVFLWRHLQKKNTFQKTNSFSFSFHSLLLLLIQIFVDKSMKSLAKYSFREEFLFWSGMSGNPRLLIWFVFIKLSLFI